MVEDLCELLALAEDALRGSRGGVSGVIFDTDVPGSLVERNTLKSGRMVYLPEQTEDLRVLGLYQFILEQCRRYAAGVGLTDAPMVMERCWVIDQRANDYQVLHAHIPNLLSGIVYLQTPPGMSVATYPDGILTLVDSSPLVVLPSPGMMYIWPGYMLHTVYPFRGEGRRLAVSFNIKHAALAERADVYYVPRYIPVSPERYYGGPS